MTLYLWKLKSSLPDRSTYILLTGPMFAHFTPTGPDRDCFHSAPSVLWERFLQYTEWRYSRDVLKRCRHGRGNTRWKFNTGPETVETGSTRYGQQPQENACNLFFEGLNYTTLVVRFVAITEEPMDPLEQLGQNIATIQLERSATVKHTGKW